MKKIADQLKNAGVENPCYEALLLKSLALNKGMSWILAHRDYSMTEAESTLLQEYVRRRTQREPYFYIAGKKDFLGMEFLVGEGVLIPRPETEILVETAADYCKNKIESENDIIRVLDIGTGTGCIAIGLASICQGVEVTACDISEEALAFANANILSLRKNFKKGSSVTAVNSDMRDYNFPTNISTGFDLIISNPPYIRTKDLQKLEPEIAFEPRTALDGGNDGFCFYRLIVNNANKLLNERGKIMLEIGHNQADAVCSIINSVEKLKVESVIKDYAGILRYVIAGDSLT